MREGALRSAACGLLTFGVFGAALLTSGPGDGEEKASHEEEAMRKSTTPRRAVLNIHVATNERAAVLEQARACGLTLSSYCRSLILGRVVTSRTDLVTVNELRRLGGLLKLVHTESRGAYSAATAAALNDVRAAIKRIAGEAEK